MKIVKDGACHTLIIDCCNKDDSAVYRFEAEGRKSEATLNIQGQEKKENYENQPKNYHFAFIFHMLSLSLKSKTRQRLTVRLLEISQSQS